VRERGRLAITLRSPLIRVKDRYLQMLWVANVCTQDGVSMYAECLPGHLLVISSGVGGPFTRYGPSLTALGVGNDRDEPRVAFGEAGPTYSVAPSFSFSRYFLPRRS
jgi:hypothetical protein